MVNWIITYMVATFPFFSARTSVFNVKAQVGAFNQKKAPGPSL